MFSFVYLVNRSRTPPVQKKRADIPKKRIRAVSDFGAVGDNLPELNSEEILANMKTNPWYFVLLIYFANFL